MISGLDILSRAIEIVEGYDTEDSLSWLTSEFLIPSQSVEHIESDYGITDKELSQFLSIELDTILECKSSESASMEVENPSSYKLTSSQSWDSTDHFDDISPSKNLRPLFPKNTNESSDTLVKSAKSTGRPSSNQMKCKFLLHETLGDALKFLDKPKKARTPLTRTMTFADCEVGNRLCEIYGVDQISFIKTFRSGNGKTWKIEIVPNRKNCSIREWKKEICYPRYKSGMKLHLIKGMLDNRSFIFDQEDEKENLVD